MIPLLPLTVRAGVLLMVMGCSLGNFFSGSVMRKN